MFLHQVSSNKKDNKKKLPWVLISFGLFALFCIVSIFGYYKIIFWNFTITSDTESFGQFGDFIGGTLNPILAFLSFMALLYTIKIQTDELKLSRQELEATREELKGSRIAQEEQSKSLKLQNKATELQTFENTFFKLLEELNQLLDKFYKEEKDEQGVNKKLQVLLGSNTINNEDYFKDEFKKINNGYMKVYFMTLYQVLKFIDDSKVNDKKRYTNIIRASLDSDILLLLLINCMVNEYEKYIKYLKDYNLLEHLSSDFRYTVWFLPILIKVKDREILVSNKDLNSFIDRHIQ